MTIEHPWTSLQPQLQQPQQSQQPQQPHLNVDHDGDEETCIVCQEQVACVPIGLTCSHRLCCSCTVQHCYVSPNTSCPICRGPTKTVPAMVLTLMHTTTGGAASLLHDEFVWRAVEVGLLPMDECAQTERILRLLNNWVEHIPEQFTEQFTEKDFHKDKVEVEDGVENEFGNENGNGNGLSIGVVPLIVSLGRYAYVGWEVFARYLNRIPYQISKSPSDQLDSQAPLLALWQVLNYDLVQHVDTTVRLRQLLERYTPPDQPDQCAVWTNVQMEVVQCARMILLINAMIQSMTSLHMMHMALVAIAEEVPMARFLLGLYFRHKADMEQNPDTRLVLQHSSTQWYMRCAASLPMARHHLALHYAYHIGVLFKSPSVAYIFSRVDAAWSNVAHYNTIQLHADRYGAASSLQHDCFFHLADTLPLAGAHYLKAFVLHNMPLLTSAHRFDVQYWLAAARLGHVDATTYLAAHSHQFAAVIDTDELRSLMVTAAATHHAPVCLAAAALSGHHRLWAAEQIGSRITCLQLYFDQLPFHGVLPATALYDRMEAATNVNQMVTSLTSYHPLYRDLRLVQIVAPLHQHHIRINTVPSRLISQLELHLVQFPDHLTAWTLLTKFVPPGHLSGRFEAAILQPPLLACALQQYACAFLQQVLFTHRLLMRVPTEWRLPLELFCSNAPLPSLQARYFLFELQHRNRLSRIHDIVRLAEDGNECALRILMETEPVTPRNTHHREHLARHKHIASDRWAHINMIRAMWNDPLCQ